MIIIFQTLARKEPGNFVCSPISAQIVTLMTKYGTNNFGKQDLSNSSNISKIEIDNLQSYSQLVANLKVPTFIQMITLIIPKIY